MSDVKSMFNAQIIDWNKGNFKIQTDNVYVSNLDLERTRLKNFFTGLNAIVQKQFEENYTKSKDETVLDMAYFEMWRFDDTYTLEGNKLTLSGVTSLNPECMSKPFNIVGRYGIDADVDAREFARYEGHSNFDRRFGIQGRFASASDPGYVNILIEGHSDLKPTFINMSKITKIPNSRELILAYNFK